MTPRTPHRSSPPWHRDASALLRASPLPIVVLDPGAIIRAWSAAAERLFGWTEAEVVGKPNPLALPEREAEFQATFARVLRGETITNAESLRRRKDGTVVDVMYNAAPIKNRRGRVAGVMATFVDTTERKHMEQALRESESRNRSVVEALDEGVTLQAADHTVVAANPSAERILGLTRDQLIGLSTFDPDWRTIREDGAPFPPEDHPSAVTLRSGRPCHNVVMGVHRPGGTRTWISINSRPLVREGEDRPYAVVTSFVDITERRRAEDALRAREARFRSLIEHSSDTITILDADGAIRYQSPSVQRVLGHRPDDAVGTLFFDYVHPDDRDSVHEAFAQGLRTPGFAVPADVRYRHRDGSWRVMEGTGRNLLDDPAVRGIVINARDITERRQIEAQFRQAQKLAAVAQLTAGIAHDFNNVLSVILANTELVSASVEDPEVRADVDDIRAAARAGASMIGKLMAYSRNAPELSVAPRDLGQVVSDVAEMLRRILPARIEVRVEGAEAPVVARVDVGAVQQIVMNLATNARDAMPDGGTLRLRLVTADMDESYQARFPWMVPGRFHGVRVSDTGTGMDQQTKERIFEPFFTTKAPGKGTGLGMAMIHDLVKQHGGCVQVESEPEAGTTVSVFFPAAALTAEATGPIRRSLETVLGAGEQILLVEDEEALRRSARRILERVGYRVLFAADGVEALDIYAAHGADVDLVISDMDMPKLGGWGLYKELRRRGMKVAFVYSSGHSTLDVDARPDADSRVFFLPKPWTIGEITRTVRQALAAGPSADA